MPWRTPRNLNGILWGNAPGSADFDTRLAVYNDAGCPPVTPIGCSDNAPGCGETSRLDLVVIEGFTYLVRVGGTQGAGTGALTISCDPF